MTATPALDALYIARIRALKPIDRTRGDARLAGLNDCIAKLAAPRPQDGTVGGQQVFMGLLSSRHYRRLRARSLVNARKFQMDGNHGAAKLHIAEAARLRGREMTQRNLEAVDMACAVMALETAEGRIGDVPVYLPVAAE